MRPSIATRLILAFAVLIAAVLIVSALALVSFPRLAGAARAFQEDALRELAIFEDVRVMIADAVHQDHAYILSAGNDAYDEAFEDDMEEIDRLLEEYALMQQRDGITAPSVEALRTLRESVELLTSAHDAVEELILEGRLPEARRVSARAGQEAAHAALQAVRKLVQEEREETRRAISAVAGGADRLHRLMLVVVALASVVGGAVAVSTVRSITIPVRRLVDVTRRVDRGTLDIHTGLAAADELGALAQSFDRMIDRLAAAFSEQERFLADISHELRTPITIVRGHLELLQRTGRTPAQVERAIATSLDELDRMGRLVQDLLLLVRAIRPDFLTLQPLDMRPFLAEVLHKAQAIAPRTWQQGPIPDVAIAADRDRLTQALLNLLRNAVEHTQADQTIMLGAEEASDWLDISITDEGAGIPAELLPHVFERFRAGAPGRTGLGLSIVLAIARAHGGDARVSSVPGRGSTFTLRLPLHRKMRPAGPGVTAV